MPRRSAPLLCLPPDWPAALRVTPAGLLDAARVLAACLIATTGDAADPEPLNQGIRVLSDLAERLQAETTGASPGNFAAQAGSGPGRCQTPADALEPSWPVPGLAAGRVAAA